MSHPTSPRPESPVSGGEATIGSATTCVHRAGTHALLLEFDDLSTVLACHQQLRNQPLPGQLELVAAARTLMIRFASPQLIGPARAQLETVELPQLEAAGAKDLELPVTYDGEDLEELAAYLDMSSEALIAWHTGQHWTAAFGGFAPGFAYCVPAAGAAAGMGPLNVPRRSSPRTAVPAGAVALAGEFSAVYPRVSPGGWQLIGHTTEAMWDLNRESPALLTPGDTVRYRAVRDRAARAAPRDSSHHDPSLQLSSQHGSSQHESFQRGTAALRVTSAGLQVLVQDSGRPGLSDLGVSRAGVADEAAAGQANRLVGNMPTAPVLEILNGGVRLHAESTVVLAITGAEAALSVTDNDGRQRHVPPCAPFALLAGEELSIDTPVRGLRSILALRGGIQAEPVLGSVSADTMSGLGPSPLHAGDMLASADLACAPVGAPELSTLRHPDELGRIRLRFTLGPRDDWFSGAEVRRLSCQSWRVTAEANRIGIRLAPDPEDPNARGLVRLSEQELPSEGVPRGSLQMPPEGNPVLFLNDHPVTGGYPVIGVLLPEDLSAAAQLRPGDLIQLVPTDPDSQEQI